MSKSSGHWHGKNFYFGFHYDLHANGGDTELGLHCAPEELAPLLKIIGADFVQTDCKGHPGYVSWFSQTPDASMPPALKQDAMAGWRAATRKLGMPLHCHYSGIWDKAAAKKHPSWAVMGAEGKRHVEGGRMCVRSPYLSKLLLPQMFELIDRYDVDGFWVDGDIWAVEFCYCPKCRKAITKATGIAEAPTETEDPNWPAWWKFNLDSFTAQICKKKTSHLSGRRDRPAGRDSAFGASSLEHHPDEGSPRHSRSRHRARSGQCASGRSLRRRHS